MKKCPYCAEEIQDKAILCRFCGRPMPGYEGQIPEAALDTKETVKNKPNRTLLYAVGVIVIVVMLGLGYILKGNGLAVQIMATPTNTPVPTALACYLQAQDFIDSVDGIITEWDDALNVASSTARMSLGPAVSQLQQIRRQVTSFDPPECAQYAQKYLADYMNMEIDGYLSFMSQDPDSTVQQKFSDASDMMDQFAREFNRIKPSSTPLPKP